jgi:mannose-6-phosphate isomerase-like protein (cupin superfamily)
MLPALILITGMMFQDSIAPLPLGVTIWPKGVPSKVDVKSVNSGAYALGIKRRSENGAAEVHGKKTDVMIVQTGEAVLQVGGEAVDLKSLGPGETHGTSIKGGVRRTVGTGDVIVIKAGVPHQFFIAPGGQITYILLKVTEQ